MKFYNKINNYLLRNHPNIWITRVHLFAPIGLLIALVLFVVNGLLIPYNLNSNLPDPGWAVVIMIIPVLVYLVYWFVFQARFNVEKSGGKLTLFQEYLNYFIYFFIFLIALLIIVAIPISNELKIHNSISKEDFNKDLEVLNLGNAVVNNNYSLSPLDNNTYSFYQKNYMDDYYYSEYDYANSNDGEEIKVTKASLTNIIDNYYKAINKYSHSYKSYSVDDIIYNNLNGSLNGDYEYDYYYYDYYNDSPSSKIYRIKRLHNKGWYGDFNEKEVYYIFGILLAVLSLFVWIFKQIHWKNFMFGIISLALTPIFVAILFFFMYEIFRFSEEFGLGLIILGYILFGIIVGLGYNSKIKQNFAIVIGMYLQLFLPFLPLFIWVLMDYRWYRVDENLDLVYLLGWIIGLTSIAVFKYIYRKMETVPAKK